MKVVHVGQDHRKDDTRIFKKECVTLAESGKEVVYITSDKNCEVGKYYDEGVEIWIYPYRPVKVKGSGIRKLLCLISNRIARIKIIYSYIVKAKPDVVHIHEYKLIYIIALLKIFYKKIAIVYDVHEDTPRHNSLRFYQKYGKIVGSIVERKYEIVEHIVCRCVDAVVVVTPHIMELLKKYNKRTVRVSNFPRINIDEKVEYDAKKRKKIVSFGGGLSRSNGIEDLLNISKNLHGDVMLAGAFDGLDYQKDYIEKYRDEIAKGKIVYKGYLTSEGMKQFYEETYVGVVLYKDGVPNNYYSYPLKLFEYMAAGVPLIVSAFPSYREIVESAECGIAVDPNDKEAVVNAINSVLDNVDLANKMSKNGVEAILDKYNWETEAQKLIDLYMQFEK